MTFWNLQRNLLASTHGFWNNHSGNSQPPYNKSDYYEAPCYEEAQANCVERAHGKKCLVSPSWSNHHSPATEHVSLEAFRWLQPQLPSDWNCMSSHLDKNCPSEPSTHRTVRKNNCYFKQISLWWFVTQQWTIETLSIVSGTWVIVSTCQLL